MSCLISLYFLGPPLCLSISPSLSLSLSHARFFCADMRSVRHALALPPHVKARALTPPTAFWAALGTSAPTKFTPWMETCKCAAKPGTSGSRHRKTTRRRLLSGQQTQSWYSGQRSCWETFKRKRSEIEKMLFKAFTEVYKRFDIVLFNDSKMIPCPRYVQVRILRSVQYWILAYAIDLAKRNMHGIELFF